MYRTSPNEQHMLEHFTLERTKQGEGKTINAHIELSFSPSNGGTIFIRDLRNSGNHDSYSNGKRGQAPDSVGEVIKLLCERGLQAITMPEQSSPA